MIYMMPSTTWFSPSNLDQNSNNKINLFLFLFVCVHARYVGIAGLDTHFWRSEDNFVKSVLSFYLYMGSGLELRLLDLFTKHFTSWANLTSTNLSSKFNMLSHVSLSLASILSSPEVCLYTWSFILTTQADLKSIMLTDDLE